MPGTPPTAMVLAAGLATRLRPITDCCPKPMVEVGGKTLLDHSLDRLADIGVHRAVVNVHYLGAMIAHHVESRNRPEILLSEETVLLETGGGVKKALPWLGPEPFFVINGDSLWVDSGEPALGKLACFWDPGRMDALLLLQPTPYAVGYTDAGSFFMDSFGRLRRRLTAGTVAPFAFIGVQILKPSLFDGMPDGPFSLREVYDRAQRDQRLFGLVHDGPWYHISTPADLQATRTVLG